MPPIFPMKHAWFRKIVWVHHDRRVICLDCAKKFYSLHNQMDCLSDKLCQDCGKGD